jgi:hypothetical protein
MKWLWLWSALLLGVAAGVPSADDAQARPALGVNGTRARSAPSFAPVVDLPPAWRTSNWGGGSCVHASTVHLLHWQGQHELAAWWREAYSGGEYASRLHARLAAAGLRYAYTVDGDEAFLEWALRTRRGAGITYFPNHAVNLVHLDAERAGLLDNNRVEQIVWIPRAEFLARWKAYGGWAWTLVYDPPPPVPYLNISSL